MQLFARCTTTLKHLKCGLQAFLLEFEFRSAAGQKYRSLDTSIPNPLTGTLAVISQSFGIPSCNLIVTRRRGSFAAIHRCLDMSILTAALRFISR